MQKRARKRQKINKTKRARNEETRDAESHGNKVKVKKALN
jgi:hypothetical protein